MPDESSISGAWMNFTNSVKVLLVPWPDDRPLDQYLSFRDTVLKIVQQQNFLSELDNTLLAANDEASQQIKDALLMELRAFPLAVEVAQTTEKDEEKRKGFFSRLLGRASTVTGSVKDILSNLPPFAKNGITLFKELLDLFKK